MQKKSVVRTYNDGIVQFYRAVTKSSSFGARVNISGMDGLKFIVKLAFGESSRRTQDLEFAEQNGFSLTLKIRVPLRPEIDNECKAVINGFLYDVKYIDTDRAKQEMYAYLEGVRKLDEGSTQQH